MTLNDEQFVKKCHELIHSLRLLPLGYKASEGEKRLSKIVIERFRDECDECKAQGERIKNMPPPKNFITKIKEAMD